MSILAVAGLAVAVPQTLALLLCCGVPVGFGAVVLFTGRVLTGDVEVRQIALELDDDALKVAAHPSPAFVGTSTPTSEVRICWAKRSTNDHWTVDLELGDGSTKLLLPAPLQRERAQFVARLVNAHLDGR